MWLGYLGLVEAFLGTIRSRSWCCTVWTPGGGGGGVLSKCENMLGAVDTSWCDVCTYRGRGVRVVVLMSVWKSAKVTKQKTINQSISS